MGGVSVGKGGDPQGLHVCVWGGGRDHVGTQLEGGHLCAKERGLRGNGPC